MKKILVGLIIATTLVLPITANACGDGGEDNLLISTRFIDKITYDAKRNLYIGTTKPNEFDATILKLEITPQNKENFDQMVSEYEGKEVGFGYVGDIDDPNTFETAWVALVDYD